MIAFHLPIVPPKATSQGAGKRIVVKDGRPMFFKNSKAQSAENDLTLLCSRHAPRDPLEGPLSLSIDFVFPWRASESKRRIAQGRAPHTVKPDCSNLVKILEDCLTKLGFWKDDSQVSDLHVSKAWGKAVGIYVAIRPVPGGRPAKKPTGAGTPDLFADG